MKEYGGYIELETNRGPEYHPDALALNCGCSCAAYLIQARGIRKMYLPAFMCDSVGAVCRRCGIETAYYRVNDRLRPVLPEQTEPDAWIYLVNFYGQLTDEEIQACRETHPRLIVDHAQAFFRQPLPGVDTLYSCRKFFGVADGAYLYTDAAGSETLEQDLSYDRMTFLLGRFEKTASEFYAQYVANNDRFAAEPVKRMSKLTHNLLRGVDYGFVKHRRTENFALLHEQFAEVNRLDLRLPEGAFMYPLYVEKGSEIRAALQKQKIYIPTLWPDVFDLCRESDTEYAMAKNILPLPVDQRYDGQDMQFLSETILKML